MVGTSLVIEVVKRSIVQCFCQSCAANVTNSQKLAKSQLTSNAPQVRPPRKVTGPLEYMSTEVRATETAKGGLMYELVLSEPPNHHSPLRQPQSIQGLSRAPNLSIDEIEKKLRAAEHRRMVNESRKMTNLNEKFVHQQEVQSKKQEFNANFMQASEENLRQRMDTMKEAREAYIRAIQDKQKTHVQHVEEVRKTLDAQSQEMMTQIHRKLEHASGVREAHIKALHKRLQEHDRHVEEVRQNKRQNVRAENHSATEVRGTEAAKGGLKYELVLSEPPNQNTPLRQPQSVNTSSIHTMDEIEKKLTAAEDRRMMNESRKMAALIEKLAHQQEVHNKKQEFNANFMHMSEENLRQKMETMKKARDTYIKAIRERQREHVQHVEEVRKTLDAQSEDMKTQINRKLEHASDVRETQNIALQKRLQDHDLHVEKVRLNKLQNIRADHHSG